VNIYKKESFISHYGKIIEVARANSQSVIITGGAGFSIYPVLIFDMLKPDYGIYGEGEESILKLVTLLSRNKNFYDHGHQSAKSRVTGTPDQLFREIRGLVYHDHSGKTVVNTRNERLETPSLRFETDLRDYYWKQSGMLNIQTKRGCPYKCIYCTYPLIEGSKVRTLEVDNVISTLKDLGQQGINYVFFTDSVFNSDNEYNNILADRIIEEKIDIKWGGYFNLSKINRDNLKKLKDAGLEHIEFRHRNRFQMKP
jgi:radical SAM superfamily enzyme YgiQ (UPF0313 family)